MPNSRHSPAIFSPSSSRATNLRRSSIGLHSFQGMFALPQKARLCNPCLRNELSPLSQEGHFTALYARTGKNSSAGSFERVSNLEENRRRVLIAWQLTISVESSPV